MPSEDKKVEPSKAETPYPGDGAAFPKIYGIEIIELLGKGGMSLVYKARQMSLDRIVAVKVLSPLAISGDEAKKRFEKEAKLTSTLVHPNIVTIIEFGISKDEQAYIVMEYLDGLSLAADLKQNGVPKLEKFKNIFLSSLSALDQAHSAGLIHRDIKPANVMICKSESESETIKLVDFGLAKLLEQDAGDAQKLTKTGTLLGSPAYMSPEQCQGKPLDARSDLYSLACVMYETLLGEPLFSGESTFELMQKHSTEPAPSANDLCKKIDIRADLAKLILSGLAKDPSLRPQSASEFARGLNAALEHATMDQIPRIRSSKAETSKKKTLITFVAIAMLGSIAFAGIHWLNIMNTEKKRLASIAIPEINNKDAKERNLLIRIKQVEKAYGTNDAFHLGGYLDNLGDYYIEKRRFAEAEKPFKRALELREKEVPKDAGLITGDLAKLAFLYFEQEKYKEAEPILQELVSNYKEQEKYVAVQKALEFLLIIYTKQGSTELAENIRKELKLNATKLQNAP